MQDTYIGDEGKGFPLVLVHGFLGSSRMWVPQIDFFKDYFRVITPDLPGYGKSNKVKSHNSIQSMANLLLDCLEEKKIDKFYFQLFLPFLEQSYLPSSVLINEICEFFFLQDNRIEN